MDGNTYLDKPYGHWCLTRKPSFVQSFRVYVVVLQGSEEFHISFDVA
jgi:hypothetical protein